MGGVLSALVLPGHGGNVFPADQGTERKDLAEEYPGKVCSSNLIGCCYGYDVESRVGRASVICCHANQK